MAQIKTNSNSITSILTVALNQKTDFRTKILRLFESKISKELTTDIVFYECTHTPLLYKEMNNKEIDIIARAPGKHKPVMMIEVKANTNEDLQKSQKKKGAYEKTSTKYDIPLLYIIPRNYAHREELPESSKIIEWEKILDIAGDISISLDTQIKQFVDLSDAEENLTDYEKKLFNDKESLLEVHTLKIKVLELINESLNENQRTIGKSENDQWGVGVYYHFNKNNFFLGFNPYISEIQDGKYFLALDIPESKNNIALEDEESLYYEEGLYYLSVFEEDSSNIEKYPNYIDRKVVCSLRNKLAEKGISEISKDIRVYFESFYSLRSKIGETEFDELFEEDSINDKKYDALIKKHKFTITQ